MRRFQLVLIKPSHYDDDGYVVQWLRSSIPSNSLAVMYTLSADAAQRQVLGADTPIDITVLDETKRVDGVETRVVEERETSNGKLVEVSRNYFAFDPVARNIYYFGEDVDMYKDGKVVNHDGRWLSGVKGAKYGLAMSGTPRVGDRYFQEVAPDIAMDRAEVVSTNEIVSTPAGIFVHCVKTEETTPLEPQSKEYKYYAPQVGLIQDGKLKLVRYRQTKD